MTHRIQPNRRRNFAALMFACAFTGGLAHAQSASSQDKQFLEDTAKDTNYEIKTGQLALQKSPSADVKQYAQMVIHDHLQLKQKIKAADAAAGVQMPSEGSMSAKDTAHYAELKVLSGNSFDQAYIKGLMKGNEESVHAGKAEAASASLPAVKSLAEYRVQLDTKHTQKADALAQAHQVETHK